MSLLSLGAGVALGIGLTALFRSALIAAAVLLLMGLAMQVAFAHRLNRHLNGADPVAMGAHSFSQLKALTPIPAFVQVLEFTAKASLWGVVAAVLQLIGWLRFT